MACKRNAMRLGDPHSSSSIAWTVERYGAIEEDTLAEIVAYLESPKGKAERTYEILDEVVVNQDTGVPMKIKSIKTTRNGSCLFKIIDNEHDAQNTLANIRNPNFGKK